MSFFFIMKSSTAILLASKYFDLSWIFNGKTKRLKIIESYKGASNWIFISQEAISWIHQ